MEAVGRHRSGIDGDGDGFAALAQALGRALSAPLVLVSLVTPDGQVGHDGHLGHDVVGAYELEPPADGAIASITALCRQVVRGGKPVIVHDVRRRLAAGSDALGALGIVGYAGVPIVLGEITIGAVAALERRVRAWSQADVDLLRSVAEGAAAIVASHRARDRERAVTDLLVAIATATTVHEVLEPIARYSAVRTRGSR